MFEVNKNDSTPMDFDLSRFGQLDTDAVVMSPFGLAVKYTSKDGKTSYRSWNRDKNRIDDVNGMVFPLEGMIFRVPCTELEVGDIIEYEGDYVFVSEVEDNGNYELLTGGGARGSHIKTTSVMGFDFYAKIVTPMKNLDSAEGGIIGIMGIMKMQMTMKMMSGGDKGQGGGMMGGGMGGMLMMKIMSGGNSGGMDFGDMFDFDGMFGDMGAKKEAPASEKKKGRPWTAAQKVKAKKTREENAKKAK